MMGQRGSGEAGTGPQNTLIHELIWFQAAHNMSVASDIPIEQILTEILAKIEGDDHAAVSWNRPLLEDFLVHIDKVFDSVGKKVVGPGKAKVCI